MATIRSSAALEFTATLTLTEVEIRAFDALVGYGDDAFIEQFKAKLGAANIRNHEKGLRSAFAAIRRDLLPALRDIDTARRDLDQAATAREVARLAALAAAASKPAAVTA